jgi:hypothetical protein
MHVARSIDADTTVRVLEGLVAERGAPALRCDTSNIWRGGRICRR